MIKFTEQERKLAVCEDVKKNLLKFVKDNGIGCYLKPPFGEYYIYLGKIDSTKQSVTFIKEDSEVSNYPDNKNTLPLFMTKQDDKIKLIVGKSSNLRGVGLDIEKITTLLDVRVTGFAISGKVFGKTEVKSTLVGQIFKGGSYYIDYGNSKKLEQETYYIGIPYTEEVNGEKINKHIKFVLSEIEFELPDLKGYCIPKDKTIREGDKVNLIYDKLGEPWVVLKVIKDKTSKRISRNSQNKMKDVITILRNGISKKVFAQHLKKV